MGLLLSCKVVMHFEDTRKVRVETMDPNSILDSVGYPKINAILVKAKRQVERVLADL